MNIQLTTIALSMTIEIIIVVERRKSFVRAMKHNDLLSLGERDLWRIKTCTIMATSIDLTNLRQAIARFLPRMQSHPRDSVFLVAGM